MISDFTSLENQFLYDDKHIYLQIVDDSRTFDCLGELQQNNAYHILVREWDPETWALGPLFEVRVDKNMHASKFSQFLSERVFPHISADNLHCSKVSSTQVKNFKRGDLILRRWSRLKTQATWLGQSTIEINRDSVYVIVKDASKTLREQLTDDELRMYASQQYLEHIAKK